MKDFIQCRLVKDDGLVMTIMTSYLPSKFAKEGQFVRLKDESGKWSDGWRVAEASRLKMKESHVIERSQDYKRTRKASDI